MDEEKKKKTKKILFRILYYVLLAFFGLVFIFSAIYIANYLIDSAQAGSEYGDLQNQYVPPSRPAITESTESTEDTSSTDSTEGTEVPDSSVSTEPPAPTEPTILPELQPFYDQNQDLVGWISVPDTKLNYPVMQTTLDNANYYLERTFERRHSAYGAIYVREQCDVFAPSDNLTIYGHHMKNGTMFAALDGYRKKSFWEAHPYVYFDTLYERHTYQVIAAFKTSANFGEGFSYHLFVDASSPGEFDQFIATAKSLAYYDTGITAQYGDKLITLSTCEYTLDNGRFVVIAKRVS